MRKNQKYSKEEMYLAIELWRENGLSQVKFCSRENLSVNTFSYLFKKYKNGKGFSSFEFGIYPLSSPRLNPGKFINRSTER
jgi:hypothetical protein